ncbi:MAG: glycosyl hydrolase, partial [Woeseiaceae bacterium]|nr:glycosyl hydrolase [Woeseiaceae bacterium]
MRTITLFVALLACVLSATPVHSLEIGTQGLRWHIEGGNWPVVDAVLDSLTSNGIGHLREPVSAALWLENYLDGEDERVDNYDVFFQKCDAAGVTVTLLLAYGACNLPDQYDSYQTAGCGSAPSFCGPVRSMPPLGAFSSDPEMTYWEKYVTDVVTRFGSYIDGAEVWNEPDEIGVLHGEPSEENSYKGFFRGSIAEYLELYRQAHSAIKSIDPSIPVAPAGLACKPSIYRSYLESLLDPVTGIYDICDAIALHTYNGTARERLKIYHEVHASLRPDPPKPVWITEFAREVNTGGEKVFSVRGARAYPYQVLDVFESYGVERAFWYSLFDEGNSSNLFRVDTAPDPDVLSDPFGNWRHLTQAVSGFVAYAASGEIGFGYQPDGQAWHGVYPFEEYTSRVGDDGHPVAVQSSFVYPDDGAQAPLTSHMHGSHVLPIAFDVNDIWVEEYRDAAFM